MDVGNSQLAQRTAATGQDASVTLLRKALDVQKQQAQSLLGALPPVESIDQGRGGRFDRYV